MSAHSTIPHLQSLPALLNTVQPPLVSITPHPYPTLSRPLTLLIHININAEKVVQVPRPVGVDNMQVDACREIKVVCEVQQRPEGEENQRMQLVSVGRRPAHLVRRQGLVPLDLELRVPSYRHEPVRHVVLLEQGGEDASGQQAILLSVNPPMHVQHRRRRTQPRRWTPSPPFA